MGTSKSESVAIPPEATNAVEMLIVWIRILLVIIEDCAGVEAYFGKQVYIAT